MNEDRINGTLTYTGTVEEVVALLREHADLADANADYFGAADIRRGADELERGLRSTYQYKAAYMVGDDEGGPDAGAAELIATGGTP